MVAAAEADDVLPVYCFDPRSYCRSAFGLVKTGAARAAFLLESVDDLKRRLRGVRSDLLVAVGAPEDVLPGMGFFWLLLLRCCVLFLRPNPTHPALLDQKTNK